MHWKNDLVKQHAHRIHPSRIGDDVSSSIADLAEFYSGDVDSISLSLNYSEGTLNSKNVNQSTSKATNICLP